MFRKRGDILIYYQILYFTIFTEIGLQEYTTTIIKIHFYKFLKLYFFDFKFQAFLKPDVVHFAILWRFPNLFWMGDSL